MAEDIAMEDSQNNRDSPPINATAVNFIPPSIDHNVLLSGETYSFYSPVPKPLQRPSPDEAGAEAILGVDEAGRGPVLGPMVYSVFYLPTDLSTPLLKDSHHFDDSKVLTAAVRADLMEKLCTPDTDLQESCGFATTALSARSIGAGMMAPGAGYNLNAQAMDATIALIRGVLGQGVNIREIYVDTIGSPTVYQAKLQREFPGIQVTVAKKADSLYPCVSAASVCAKVTRDVALEVLYSAYKKDVDGGSDEPAAAGWGSGYPSDRRCVSWLRNNMHPVFGWGPECRYSWGTAKDMLELKGGVKVEWPVEEDESTTKMTDFFSAKDDDDGDELATWFGRPTGQECF
ncbi:ribonuclease HII [Zalerion maritima]|uniref:Ribonuclease n=1 Tax=Zalerion maritima TaxID=339359 RepID=A0AAD5RVP0_9PEZI|nr:ribonuclease HII [Zalerion maritima]